MSAETESRAPFTAAEERWLRARTEEEGDDRAVPVRSGFVDVRWPDGLVHRSVFEGKKLTPREVYGYALAAGFSRPLPAILMTAIVYAESGGWTGAKLLYGTDSERFAPSDPLAFDCGLCQISSIHGDDIDALEEPEFNCRRAHDLYLRRDRQFTAWMAFTGGYHLRHLRKAVKGQANYYVERLDLEPPFL
jgi:hypothetical protein